VLATWQFIIIHNNVRSSNTPAGLYVSNKVREAVLYSRCSTSLEYLIAFIKRLPHNTNTKAKNMYQCNFHEVNFTKAFLSPEKIVPDREQQQKLHYYAIRWQQRLSLWVCQSVEKTFILKRLNCCEHGTRRNWQMLWLALSVTGKPLNC